MISQGRIEQFKLLWLKHYGLKITDEEALKILVNLVEAVKLALPIKNN